MVTVPRALLEYLMARAEALENEGRALRTLLSELALGQTVATGSAEMLATLEAPSEPETLTEKDESADALESPLAGPLQLYGDTLFGVRKTPDAEIEEIHDQASLVASITEVIAKHRVIFEMAMHERATETTKKPIPAPPEDNAQYRTFIDKYARSATWVEVGSNGTPINYEMRYLPRHVKDEASRPQLISFSVKTAHDIPDPATGGRIQQDRKTVTFIFRNNRLRQLRLLNESEDFSKSYGGTIGIVTGQEDIIVLNGSVEVWRRAGKREPDYMSFSRDLHFSGTAKHCIPYKYDSAKRQLVRGAGSGPTDVMTSQQCIDLAAAIVGEAPPVPDYL